MSSGKDTYQEYEKQFLNVARVVNTDVANLLKTGRALAVPANAAPAHEDTRYQRYLEGKSTMLGKLLFDLEKEVENLMLGEADHDDQVDRVDIAAVLERVKHHCIGQG